MSNPDRIYFRNEDYDGQLARTLALAGTQSADLGEALSAARAVGTPSGAAWHEAWAAVAAHAGQAADRALEAGDRVSARSAYLRASEYHRQSYYFLRSDLGDQRLIDGHACQVAAFRAALPLLDVQAEQVEIPYEGTTLNAYLLSPDGTGRPRPTILMPCGYDSTAESWADAPGALARGYNALVFEGPGQGRALYRQGLYFRPDFENVLGPVLDWLATRAEADTRGTVLFGRSFAGYLSPRAAAFEHRLAALVCDPAQPRMAARLPEGPVARVAAPIVRGQMALSDKRAEFFGARMAAHGIDSIEQYFAELHRYEMIDVAKRITCPTLIIEADGDFAGGGGAELRDAMTAPVDLVELTRDQGASGHCAGLGQQVWLGVVYPWLSGVMRKAGCPPLPAE